MTVRLDVVDRKILSELQKDASRSLDDIAKTIGASKRLFGTESRNCAKRG